MNAYTPLLWSPRDLFEQIDAAESGHAITRTQAAVLRRRVDGLTLGEVGEERGTSKAAVFDAQGKALRRMGHDADLIERLLDNEKARRAAVLHRRYRCCWSVPLHEQRNDLGIERTGLDAAATRLLAGAC